ncbi:MAG TPA: hypothetical protein VKZ81_24700 [Pseudonocardia sp.]|jgi:hypothetical protein|nr:hypothetical protein [Pseudonocardia sp.]HLU58673.1 hypothetical protein [Pseudonocardia sp.]
MPDRYADAVVARRRELRELRERLGGSHRGELRGCLALSRLTAARDAERALADLRREAAEHVRCGDRAARRRLPDLVAAAVDALAADAAARWAADLAPALRRIATERELAVGPGWPRLPAASPPGPPPTDEPAPDRPLLTRLVEGVALGRLALFPLAVLPLAGLPALGGPALAPLAVVVGLAALAVATCARRAAAERERLRRRVERIVQAAAVAIEADLDRRLVEVELAASTALDAAVLRRRAEVDRELAALAPAGAGRG